MPLSAGAVEYADCIFAEGNYLSSPNRATCSSERGDYLQRICLWSKSFSLFLYANNSFNNKIIYLQNIHLQIIYTKK